MNTILDIKAMLSFLGLVAFSSLTPDHVYKFISFIVVVGYQAHRWYKFHQDNKIKK